jgi:hypothetical protein
MSQDSPEAFTPALTLIGNSAISGKTASFGEDGLQNDFIGASLRRVRMFDDVEVVSNFTVNHSIVSTPKFIVDNPNNVDPFGDEDFFDKYDDIALFVENTLDVHGTLYVEKPVETVGFKQQRFPYDPSTYKVEVSYTLQPTPGINPEEEYDETVDGTKLSNYLLTDPVVYDVDFSDHTTLSVDDSRIRHNREIIDRNVRATSDPELFDTFSREVKIPADTTNPYNFIIVYFGGTMTMRGGMSLWIRSATGSKQEIKWPNIHNLNMHDFRMGADLYSMTGQAVIQSGSTTRGTTWNGRDKSEINLATMASFDSDVDNYIYIDLSTGDDAPRKDREADLLVADWNDDLAGRAISSISDLSGFGDEDDPKRWPARSDYTMSGYIREVDGSDYTVKMNTPIREEIDDMLPYEAYYPYLYVVGVRDTVYEVIDSSE